MPIVIRSNRVILAESDPTFRASAAKALGMAEDLRIVAQCPDLDRMYNAIATHPGSIVLFSASLEPDLARLLMLLEVTSSRGIVIVENNDIADTYMQLGFDGVVFRDANGPAMVECVHKVADGEFCVPPQLMQSRSLNENMGAHVSHGLSNFEMQFSSQVKFGLRMRIKAIITENKRSLAAA